MASLIKVHKLAMGGRQAKFVWGPLLMLAQQVCFPRDMLPPFVFKPGYHVWVARYGNQFAGYARARIAEGSERTALRLEECAVLPKYRGKGIQRRLIKARETWGRRQGAQVSLTYTVNNPASEANLKHAGYTLRQDPTANVWRKEL